MRSPDDERALEGTAVAPDVSGNSTFALIGSVVFQGIRDNECALRRTATRDLVPYVSSPRTYAFCRLASSTRAPFVRKFAAPFSLYNRGDVIDADANGIHWGFRTPGGSRFDDEGLQGAGWKARGASVRELSCGFDDSFGGPAVFDCCCSCSCSCSGGRRRCCCCCCWLLLMSLIVVVVIVTVVVVCLFSARNRFLGWTLRGCWLSRRSSPDSACINPAATATAAATAAFLTSQARYPCSETGGKRVLRTFSVEKHPPPI